MARGSIKKRYESSWTVRIDLGYSTDPETGHRRRRQRTVSVQGTKRQAEKRLVELLHEYNENELLAPSKRTLGKWLERWVTHRIEPNKRPGTTESYRSVIKTHLSPGLGSIPLQDLTFAHLERYYERKSKTLAPATLEIHHSILSGSLRWAVRKQLIKQNPAQLVDHRPSKPSTARYQVWTAEQAHAFIKAADEWSIQAGAFYALAVDSGARKAELCGLRWRNVVLDRGRVTICEQLSTPGRNPHFWTAKEGPSPE